MTDGREEELRVRLAAVRDRVARACAEAGRPAEEVTLVVVTKFFPASDVRLLSGLGVRHVGENRHQEAVAKKAECPDLDLVWHFIGRLQSNKAAAVGEWADVVQSVDRSRLVSGLSRAAASRPGPLDVLLQVSLDPPGSSGGRSGVAPEEVADLAAEVVAQERLRLRGVMGVAPRPTDPGPTDPGPTDPRAAFLLLRRAADDVRRVAPEADWISAGMSGDLEAAIALGATHVRVGSAVLGNRPGHR